MSVEEKLPLRDNGCTPTTIKWSQAIYYHFLFFVHWLLPAKEFKELDQNALKTPKVQFLAFLNILVTTWIISLAFLGITEGPIVLTEFLQFNLLVYSQMLLNYAIYTFAFYLLLVSALTFLLPFIFNTLVNIKALKAKELSMSQIFLTSSYGMLSILFFIPMVYAIALIVPGNLIQIVELEMNDWQTPIWYVLGLLIIISLLLSAILNRKAWPITSKSIIHAGLGILVTFLLIAVICSLFFLD
jgi:hypothetical protein